MLNSISFLLDLLRNHIPYPQKNYYVPVIKRSYPFDKSPCICLDDSGGATVIHKYRVHNPYEELHDRIESYVNIHVYCNKEDERDYILREIRNAVYKLESDNYTYCSQYDDDQTCKTLGTPCPVLKRSMAKSVKGQCPDPKKYGYKSLYNKYNIIRNSVEIHPAFSIDDLTKSPILLHSVIRTSMVYDTKYELDGLIPESMKNRTTI